MATVVERTPARSKGSLNQPPVKLAPSGDTLAEAIQSEQALAEEAAEIRGGAHELSQTLFLKLYPLLRRPIPAGFVLEVTAGKGKPYDSVGVRSVQVLIDRMDNVLSPLWWEDECSYSKEGQLAHVKIHVGSDRRHPLFTRESHGGVDRGSTLGNVYKGSYTNAAKLAFARVGPGHEIYLGAADYDPDTNEQAAEAQAQAETPPAVETVPADRVARLMELFAGIDTKDDADKEKLKKDLKLKLGSIGVSGSTVGQALAKLTPGQADEVDSWLSGEVDRRSA